MQSSDILPPEPDLSEYAEYYALQTFCKGCKLRRKEYSRLRRARHARVYGRRV